MMDDGMRFADARNAVSDLMNENSAKNTSKSSSSGNTTFYNLKGELLGNIDNDETGTSNVSFVDLTVEDFEQQFGLAKLSMLHGNGTMASIAKDFRDMGFTYDTDEIFSFYDNNNSDYDTDQSNYRPDDGNGLLANEHGFKFYIKEGFLRLGGNMRGDPANVRIPGEDDNEAVAKGHMHPNEGRLILRLKDGRWEPAEFPRGPSALGTPNTGGLDISQSWNNGNKRAGTHYFDVVVTKTSIYFYNRSGIVVTFNR